MRGFTEGHKATARVKEEARDVPTQRGQQTAVLPPRSAGSAGRRPTPLRTPEREEPIGRPGARRTCPRRLCVRRRRTCYRRELSDVSDERYRDDARAPPSAPRGGRGRTPSPAASGSTPKKRLLESGTHCSGAFTPGPSASSEVVTIRTVIRVRSMVRTRPTLGDLLEVTTWAEGHAARWD